MPPIAKQLRAKLGLLLRRSPLLPRGASLLVAVSGGQDSVCLLQLLLWWRKHWQWQLVVGHCDHRWRSDSAVNATHVQKLAKNLSLPFLIKVADRVPTSEASARSWRYQALAELAQVQECAVVVTGHTLSDRVETFVYNLLRGSGGSGLGAMAWRRPIFEGSPIQLVRPLLGISRAETGAFCQALQLPVYWDSTNEDLHYRRNRIRQELIPYLKQQFNPQVEIALAQTAELLQADHQYLESLAQAFWQDHSLGADRVDRLALSAHPPALQTRIIRQYLHHHLTQQVDYGHIQKFQLLLTAPDHSQSDPLPSGVVAIVQHPYICLKMLS